MNHAAVAPDFHAVIGTDQQHNLLLQWTLQPAIGVTRCVIDVAVFFVEIEHSHAAFHLLPRDGSLRRFVVGSQIDGCRFGWVNGLESAFVIRKGTGRPHFGNARRPRRLQSLSCGGNANLGDLRFGSRVAQQRQKMHRLQPHRFIGVAESFSQQNEQGFLLGRAFARVPMFGDRKQPDATVLPQIDFFIGVLHMINFFRTPRCERQVLGNG